MQYGAILLMTFEHNNLMNESNGNWNGKIWRYFFNFDHNDEKAFEKFVVSIPKHRILLLGSLNIYYSVILAKIIGRRF